MKKKNRIKCCHTAKRTKRYSNEEN